MTAKSRKRSKPITAAQRVDAYVETWAKIHAEIEPVMSTWAREATRNSSIMWYFLFGHTRLSIARSMHRCATTPDCAGGCVMTRRAAREFNAADFFDRAFNTHPATRVVMGAAAEAVRRFGPWARDGEGRWVRG